MPANVYECMFILDTTKVAGDIATADKQLRTILEKHGAEVLVSRPWDERRLSYPIRNQKKGLYYITYFSSEGKNITPIERDCAITEMILRMMVIKIDPKLVDTMLALAKGEHATALHNYQEEPGEGEPAAAPAGGGGPARSEEEGEPVGAGAGRRGRAPRE
jgi:small subunit ribosomal protein S6